MNLNILNAVNKELIDISNRLDSIEALLLIILGILVIQLLYKLIE